MFDSDLCNGASLEWELPSIVTITANKQICSEALDSFYKENMPVSIRTNDHHFLQNFASKIIPMKFLGDEIPTNGALSVELLLLSGAAMDSANPAVWEMYGTDCSCIQCEYGFSAAIIPGQYLPTLVQLLNSYAATTRFNQRLWMDGPFRRLVFNFSQSKARFGETTVEKLANSLRGIRRVIKRGTERSPWCKIVFTGLLSEDVLELEGSTLPPLSGEECLEQARSLKEQGDALLAEKGKYVRARELYYLAIVILNVGSITIFHELTKVRWYRGDLPFEGLALLFSIYYSLEKVSTKLGLDCESQKFAKAVRTMLRTLGWDSWHRPYTE